MSDELAALIQRAFERRMSDAEREEQRRSFAYGNIKLANERVTRRMVDEQAEILEGRMHC